MRPASTPDSLIAAFMLIAAVTLAAYIILTVLT